MQVKLYASLRQKAGSKLVEVTTPPDPTLRDALLDLTRRYPALHEHIWAKDGSAVEFVHILVNGSDMRRLQGLDTPLKPEDSVDIFPSLVGG